MTDKWELVAVVNFAGGMCELRILKMTKSGGTELYRLESWHCDPDNSNEMIRSREQSTSPTVLESQSFPNLHRAMTEVADAIGG